MAPAIVESRILSREGDLFRVWLRLQQRDMISAVFDLVLRITYRPVETGSLKSNRERKASRGIRRGRSTRCRGQGS